MTQSEFDAQPWAYRVLGMRWPRIEEWLVIAFVAITWNILDALHHNPALLGIPAYMQFAGQVVTGGLLLAGSHYFQKQSREGDKLTQTLADKVPPPTGEALDGTANQGATTRSTDVGGDSVRQPESDVGSPGPLAFGDAEPDAAPTAR